MDSQFKLRGRDFFNRLFPERQIYHRSGGTVRYVSLSPWKQALYAGGGLLAVTWCLYATVKAVTAPNPNNVADQSSAKYERWLQEAHAKETAAIQQLQERTKAFEQATLDFERRHETLAHLLEAVGGKDPSSIEAPLTRDNGAVLVRASIEEAEPRVSRYSGLETAAPEVAGFRGRIEELRREQDEFLDATEEASLTRADEARAILNLTGVRTDRLVDRGGVGGPLVELDQYLFSNSDSVDAGFSKRVREVAARLQETRLLEKAMAATPLAVPVLANYRETSGFGRRFDPFTGRVAVHDGLDLASFNRAPIVAGAPGVVTYAGVRSGYGNVVEIDHGFGFHTRYGHLAQIFVKVGQRVAITDRIGAMGSTGRSTATHLHYEVSFDGKVMDPLPFIRAGEHVRQG